MTVNDSYCGDDDDDVLAVDAASASQVRSSPQLNTPASRSCRREGHTRTAQLRTSAMPITAASHGSERAGERASERPAVAAMIRHQEWLKKKSSTTRRSYRVVTLTTRACFCRCHRCHRCCRCHRRCCCRCHRCCSCHCHRCCSLTDKRRVKDLL